MALSAAAFRSTINHYSGLSAESQVAAYYRRSGREIAARRWRGRGGEIDLVAREGDVVVFIEVKASATHAQAAELLTRRQMHRMQAAASEFIAAEPGGQNTDVRIDIALVDKAGQIEILENAYGFE